MSIYPVSSYLGDLKEPDGTHVAAECVHELQPCVDAVRAPAQSAQDLLCALSPICRHSYHTTSNRTKNKREKLNNFTVAAFNSKFSQAELNYQCETDKFSATGRISWV
jgi:hypothetical protein